MKKIAILLIATFGILMFDACKKVETDPKLQMSQSNAPAITSPADGSSWVLLEENASDPITFEWAAAAYNLTDLEPATYALTMVVPSVETVELVNSTETSFTTTVGGLNANLIGMDLPGGEAVNVEFRVTASLKGYENGNVIESTVLNSAIVNASITPYEDLIIIPPIYMLGSGTTVGWNNGEALPMTNIGDGKFARVETLTGGADQFVKWISDLNNWAPQWGTDDNGTLASGNMVYRPTEDDPDPPGVPVADDENGPYYIEADTANLTYMTYLTSGELYLVGDASSAGWDNTNGIQFTEEAPHIFTLTTDLNAEGGMKFLEVPGEWAPQWGTNDTGKATDGLLVYRPNESVPDPSNIPAPSAAGSYTIRVDMTTMEYTITPN